MFIFKQELFQILYNESKNHLSDIIPQPAFTCSMLTKETLEQGVKYVYC